MGCYSLPLTFTAESKGEPPLKLYNHLPCPDCVTAAILPLGKSGSITPPSTVTLFYASVSMVLAIMPSWQDGKLKSEDILVVSTGKSFFPWELGALTKVQREKQNVLNGL